MATFWDRIQAAAKAARSAWQGNDMTLQPRAATADQAYADGLTGAQRERLKKYTLLWAYYDGRHKKQLKTKPGQPDENVTINHARRIVNLSAFFLFGKEVRWELQKGGARTAEEKLLDHIWGGSSEQRMALLGDVALNGGVCGTPYLQLLPPDQRHDLPRIVNLNPSIVFPQWNPSDVTEVWVYELRWRAGERVLRDIYTLTDAQTWEIHHEEFTGRKWEALREADKWDWEWAPILHAKNLPNPNEFFGLSDLEDADLGDAVNFIASNTNRVLRLFAHPQLWGYGFGQGDLAADPGKIILGKSPEANLQMLQMAGNMGASDAYLHALTKWLYSTAGSVEMDPETLRLGAQSGFALTVLHQPLLQITERKRASYGALIIEANRRVLDMLGKGEQRETTLHWQDPLPLDKTAQNEWDRFDLDMGLASKETVATRRGLDWQQEQERRDLEREKALEEQRESSNVGAELLKAFEGGQDMPPQRKALPFEGNGQQAQMQMLQGGKG